MTVSKGIVDQAPVICAANNPLTGPSGLAAVAAHVETLICEGRMKEAESTILEVLKQPNKRWEHYVILGQVYAAQKLAHEAKEAFRHAVVVGPLQGRPHFRLGEYLLRNGELREAEEEIRAAIRIDPITSEFHASLGAILLEQGWIKDASASLRRAIRLDRRSARPQEILGKLLVGKGDYRGAEKAFLKALALDPASRSVLASLAKIFEERGKTDKAVACLGKIIALNPSNAGLLIRISRQHKQAGRLREAEKAIRAALAVQPIAESYVSLCEILNTQSRRGEAIDAMSEACRLDTGNRTYRTHLTKLVAMNDVAVTGPQLKSAELLVERSPFGLRLRKVGKLCVCWRKTKSD